MNVIANELIVNEFDCKYLYSTGGLYKVILIASELKANVDSSGGRIANECDRK